MPRGRQELNAIPWTDRFWSMVEKQPDGCWLWTGYTTPEGYGKFSFRRSAEDARQETWRVHRLAYTLVVGTIPDGLQIDHLCRVRHCVNPEHLEPVTNEENSWRGTAPTIVASAQNLCLRGHSLDDAVIDHRGRRTCRTCRTHRSRRTAARRAAAVAALDVVQELLADVAQDGRRFDEFLDDTASDAVAQFAAAVNDLINRNAPAPVAAGRAHDQEGTS